MIKPEEQIREFAIYGTPEDVLRQIRLFEQFDIQYLIVDLDPSRELEALDVFANKIIKKILNKIILVCSYNADASGLVPCIY